MSPPGRARRAAIAAAFLLIAGPALAENRTLRLHNIHTHEDLTITYKRNGRFDDDALKRLNTFMRDWRREEEVKMDPQLFDMLWEVHREVKASGPIHVVCGYRSSGTNAMLRSRSGGVARNSLHMQGKAIDFSIPSAEVAAVRAAALRIQGGGVGYYPASGIPFVHMDVGNVRHWPRMTREQLAKVFPDGRTIHVPSDGNPMPGYELAAADIERGRRPASQASPQRSLLAALFSGAQDAEETDDNAAAANRPAPAPAATPARRQVAAATPAAEPPAQVPLPLRRPSFQVASAESVPVAAPRPRLAAAAEVPAPAPAPAARPVNLASLSPNQIIDARGFWQGPAAGAIETSGSARTASAARPAPSTTASVGPFVRNDRVPAEIALAYASPGDPEPRPATAGRAPARRAATAPAPAPAVVSTYGLASVAAKPAEAPVRTAPAAAQMQNPWLRAVVLAPSLHRGMTTTTFGASDPRALQPMMQKPATAVVMTFTTDPHLGMTTDRFSGSAIVFHATVTFGMRTALLNQ